MTVLNVLVQTPFARATGWALFHSLWEGVLVAAVLAAALSVTRSPAARYIAACVAMLALLAGFAFTFAWHVPQLAPSKLVEGNNAIPARLSIDIIGGALPNADRLTRILPWLTPFWMTGVLLLYARQLAEWIAVRRLRHGGVCQAPDSWQRQLERLAERVGVSRSIELLESALAQAPFVLGYWRPVILVPVGLLVGMPSAQIEAILLHELAHIRRRDYLINMLQTAVEGLLFFHPAVWWISGVMRTEREHCCDDCAALLSGDVHQYALALAALEENRHRLSEAALAATGGSLVKRIRRLLYQPQRPSSALTPLFSAAILMIAFAVGLAAWQSKPRAPVFPEQFPPAQAQQQQVSPYTKWLEEEAVYIITAQERAAFLSLQTDGERNHFIEQFWLRRDPTPGTPENEFLEEHYRRIQYANDQFATRSGTAGWRTDRGHIYIIFGPPDEREAYGPDRTRTLPWEHWRYRLIEGIGADVNMEFVDRAGTGDYRMTVDPNENRGVTNPRQQ